MTSFKLLSINLTNSHEVYFVVACSWLDYNKNLRKLQVYADSILLELMPINPAVYLTLSSLPNLYFFPVLLD